MILVTGGTGLIGAHLLYTLALTHDKVIALCRNENRIINTEKIFSYYANNDKRLFQKIEWRVGDVLDYFSLLEAMDGVTAVYHCAAMVSFLKKDEEAMIKINASGTANIVNAALEKKIKKFCYVSSVAAFGEHPDMTHINESTPWKGADKYNFYAKSKYAAEREVWRASEEGLNVIIVNPSIVIGPGIWSESSSKIFSVANRGLIFYPPGVAGYVDVRDVAICMVRLMASDIVNQNYIVSAENLSYQKFLSIISKALNKKAPTIKATKTILRVASFFERIICTCLLKTPNLTRTIIRAVSTKTYYENAKIKNTINMNFIPVGDAVKWAAERYIANTKS